MKQSNDESIYTIHVSGVKYSNVKPSSTNAFLESNYPHDIAKIYLMGELWRIQKGIVSLYSMDVLDMPKSIYIPDNEYKIQAGYWTMSGIVYLLRLHKRKPNVIQFIADMME